jgi:hypothetical protein
VVICVCVITEFTVLVFCISCAMLLSAIDMLFVPHSSCLLEEPFGCAGERTITIPNTEHCGQMQDFVLQRVIHSVNTGR